VSYRYSIDESRNFVLLVFSGDTAYAEEAEALLAVSSDERLRPDARILVDKRSAAMRVAPQDTRLHVELVRAQEKRLGRPRVAHVVSRDADFGMLRMLEMVSESQLKHEFRVFRSLDEACAWLEIDLEDVELG
jgi:hypothetical protein